jgi:hypothetical protein
MCCRLEFGISLQEFRNFPPKCQSGEGHQKVEQTNAVGVILCPNQCLEVSSHNPCNLSRISIERDKSIKQDIPRKSVQLDMYLPNTSQLTTKRRTPEQFVPVRRLDLYSFFNSSRNSMRSRCTLALCWR